MNKLEIENIEIDLLLDAVYRRYGYDFRDYTRVTIKRRIHQRMQQGRYQSVSEIIPEVLYHKAAFHKFILDMSVTVTEMFRDPHCYEVMLTHAIPYLKTFPYIKIWHAGCATGEEVYSLAILLDQMNLLERAQIYATDINLHALTIAKEGIYHKTDIQLAHKNYESLNRSVPLNEYYTKSYQSIRIKKSIRDRITFSHHNLAGDGVFGEMHLILCRNVMIYFNSMLKNKVMQLFFDSLAPRGYLVLGTKEYISGTIIEDEFETVAAKEQIFRKFPKDLKDATI